MKVQDVMVRGVTSVTPDTPIMEAAAQMRDNDFGFLPVVEADDIVGTLTDRDIVINAVAQGKVLEETAVRDAMNSGAICVAPDDEIELAAHAMENKQIRRLIVVDDDRKIVGTLSLGDMAAAGGTKDQAGGALTEIARG